MPDVNLDDTIAAVATPVGVGAIGVVRLSGKDALRIVSAVFRSPNADKKQHNTSSRLHSSNNTHGNNTHGTSSRPLSKALYNNKRSGTQTYQWCQSSIHFLNGNSRQKPGMPSFDGFHRFKLLADKNLRFDFID